MTSLPGSGNGASPRQATDRAHQDPAPHEISVMSRPDTWERQRGHHGGWVRARCRDASPSSGRVTYILPPSRSRDIRKNTYFPSDELRRAYVLGGRDSARKDRKDWRRGHRAGRTRPHPVFSRREIPALSPGTVVWVWCSRYPRLIEVVGLEPTSVATRLPPGTLVH